MVPIRPVPKYPVTPVHETLAWWIEVVGVLVLVAMVVELTRIHETLAFLDRGGGGHGGC